jgi:hypothetical protein
MSPEALVLLSLEVAPLGDLIEWEPVGSLLETLAGAARGHDAISEYDVGRLRTWARRWPLLPDELREWYATRAIDNDDVSTTLRAVLEGSRPPAAARTNARLLWSRDHGFDPPYDIAPRLVLI